MNPEIGYQLYRDVGVAGLFIFLYLATLVTFIRDLKAQRKEAQEMTERVIKAMDSSSISSVKAAEVLEKVKGTIEDNTRKMSEFIAFLKGRDDREA